MTEEKEEAATQAAETEMNSADMNGFALLQIIAYTNAEIRVCKEKLENESSGRRLAYLQLKIKAAG